MKKSISLLFIAVLLVGCATAHRITTTACNWMTQYIQVADDAVVKIQANYQTYADIATGLVPASAAVVAKAKAWLAVADISLRTLGAVQKGICVELTDIILALESAKEGLPKLAI